MLITKLFYFLYKHAKNNKNLLFVDIKGNKITMNENVEVSIKKGMLFKFYYNNRLITYDCSPVSGKEVVMIDGEVISESKSYKMSSSHEFVLDGKAAKINLSLKGFTKNVTICEFFVAGELINAYQLTYGSKGNIPLMARIIMLIIAATIGWFYAAQVIDEWLAFAIAIIPSVAIMFKFEKPNWTCEDLLKS